MGTHCGSEGDTVRGTGVGSLPAKHEASETGVNASTEGATDGGYRTYVGRAPHAQSDGMAL